MSTTRALIAVFFAVSAAGCAATAAEDEGSAATNEGAQKIDCSYVKCAMPLCADGQHLVQSQGSCCPTCVGRPSKCATVLCAAVECAEGEQRVYSNGDCCGHCVKTPAVKECKTDLDCPQIYCIACPCPVSTCRGGSCVSTTPADSTCGTL